MQEVIEEAESFEVNEGITEGALAGELGLPVMARSPGCKRRGSASRSFKWWEHGGGKQMGQTSMCLSEFLGTPLNGGRSEVAYKPFQG